MAFLVNSSKVLHFYVCSMGSVVAEDADFAVSIGIGVGYEYRISLSVDAISLIP